MLWSQGILTPSKPSSHRNGLEWKENGRSAEGTQNMSRLDLKHNECRRVRISWGYKAGELQPHYLIQLKYKLWSWQKLHNVRIYSWYPRQHTLFPFISLCITTPWPEHVVKLLIMQPLIICLPFTMEDMWYWSIVNIPLKVYGQPVVIHELGLDLTTVIKIYPRPSVAGGQQ